MDLRQLQALIAVAEHGSFTAAARATHTVQSNVSTHIARLEKELRTTLIDRATGTPTQEGEAAIARARRVLDELSALEADVASLQGSPQGTVRVGVIGTTARWITPHLVDAVAEATPEVKLVIADGSTSSILLRLIEGQIDLGVIGLPIEAPELRTIPLFREDRIVVAPAGHPLAERGGRIELAELATHDLLLAATGTSFRTEIDAAFAEFGLRVTPLLEIDGLRLLASLAFQGYGPAILPATAAPGWIGGDWTRITVPQLGRRTVGVALRRRGLATSAVDAVIEATRTVVNAQAPEVPGLHLPN